MDLDDLFQAPDDADPEVEDELDNTVVLTDEDGNDTAFEFLDIVECGGHEYAVLMPVEDADGQVVIFRIEDEGDDESYVGVETEEEAQRVFEVFREKNRDDFNFTD